MEAATYPTLLRLRLPPAGANRDYSNASWKLPRVLELSSSLRRLTTGDGRHVSGGATVRGHCGPLAVLAAVSVLAVSVAAVLSAGLAVVHGSAPAEGESRMSPAASDSCPLGKRLGTVAAAVDALEGVQVAVQVAVQLVVFTAVQVGVDRRCDLVSATMPSPDLSFCFWPFPTFDGGAVVLPLSPFVSAEPLVAGSFGFSLWDVGTFFTLAGGGMSLHSLHGTLAALMGGALHDPAVAGTMVPGDVVAEVLGWDLESLALGEGLGEV
ncbi:hypothetical protein NDU88_003621 [Pleurodeles waltl]|uniref:Uncharacterized protein n=1 Tax=Pleurodeles waltl TaxID=8319 RepID=A0AAV7UYZ7_PLEWA|nr:hypothetical protein NDU88_003621 [Pleurodeles waltl]